MQDMEVFAKLLMALGLAVMMVGAIMLVSSKMGFALFHLPGDIVIKRDTYTLYLPIMTGILLSLVFSLVYRIFVGK